MWMTHYFKDDDKDVLNNGNGITDQRNMYPNPGINAAAAVAASRHPVSVELYRKKSQFWFQP